VIVVAVRWYLRYGLSYRDVEEPNGTAGTPARRAQEEARRKRSAVAARQRHLDALAVDQPAVWQQVNELIATKKPSEYDTAVRLLVDLRDLGERDGNTAHFRQRLAELRTIHVRKPSLLERLQLAGLDG
jgi:hypothetical protein